MHSEPVSTASTENLQTPSGTQAVPIPTQGVVASDPSPVSPLGFAGLSGLIGLAGGMVLQPWLERAYRKMNKKDIKK
jgi:hypothetical protein